MPDYATRDEFTALSDKLDTHFSRVEARFDRLDVDNAVLKSQMRWVIAIMSAVGLSALGIAAKLIAERL